MAPRDPYLTRRGNTFYFRRAFPVAVVAHFGRREFSLSLRTNGLVTARRRWRMAANVFESALSKAERTLAELPEIARDGDRRCVGVDLRDPVGIVVGLGGAEDKAVDLCRVETDDLDIEVELDLAERLQLYRQQFLVPTGQLGQAVVGDDVRLNLCFGEVAQPDCRDLFEPEQLRRCQASVARDDLPVLIDQDGVRPA